MVPRLLEPASNPARSNPAAPARKADLHVHSSWSHDVPDLPRCRPRALFERAMAHPDASRRMDYFALTDHETMGGYEELRRDLPEADRRLVIPGVEHALLDPAIGFSIHANLFGLDPDQYAELRARVRTLPELAEFCRARGIRMQYNHPTWWERGELRAGRVALAKVAQAAEHFDLLELNAGLTELLNRATESLARAMGKHLACSSDTHTGEVGKAHTLAPGEDAAAFLAAVWSGRGVPVRDDIDGGALLGEVQGVIDHLFDHRRGVRLKAGATDSGSPRLERLAHRVLGSDRIMGNPVTREPLRALLKQAARPVVWSVMARERGLERRLLASPLAGYL